MKSKWGMEYILGEEEFLLKSITKYNKGAKEEICDFIRLI